ncbi:hypothetical protein BC830DRAFT_1095487 [Chytriomyces sp. MP71]|nr:hypothetical protein BC830DRAFT_1095487 [Chytriomyces sp. MP71]
MTMQTPASISPSHLPTEDEGEDFDDQETVRSSMSPRLDSGHELGPAKRTALAHLRMNAEPEPFSSTRIAVSLLPLVPQISMRKNRVKGKPLECPAPGCGKKFNFPSGLAEHYR